MQAFHHRQQAAQYTSGLGYPTTPPGYPPLYAPPPAPPTSGFHRYAPLPAPPPMAWTLQPPPWALGPAPSGGVALSSRL
jgi:hypothetical protein